MGIPFLQSFPSRSTSSVSSSSSKRRRRYRRHRCESLESRRLLAAVITVTSLEDNLAVDGQVTLREAIQAANTNQNVDGSGAGNGGDIINFAPELAGGTINLTQGQLNITESLTIGAGSLGITIDGGGQSRLLSFTSSAAADLSLQGLTLTGGQTTSGDGGAVLFDSDGLLFISQSTLTGNSALGSGQGGGIGVVDGDLRLVESEVSGNLSGGDGGGINVEFGESVSLIDSSISNNTAGMDGGGVATFGSSLEVVNSTLNNNAAIGTIGDGGAIAIQSSGAFARITGSELSGNSANASGGAIDNGTSFLPLTIIDSVLSDNVAGSGDGGAIDSFDDVFITDSVLSGNTADNDGGAIDLSGISTLVLTRSSILNNVAGQTSFGDGGGINALNGTIRVIDSTIAGNVAEDAGGGISAFTGLIEVRGSTLSSNSAGDDGGGIEFTFGNVVVENSTITANVASGTGGGIISGAFSAGTDQRLTIISSIVAGNMDSGGAPDFQALGDNTINPLENLIQFSLIGNGIGTGLTPSPLITPTTAPTADAQGNLVGGAGFFPLDPQLGPLQDNGGPTLTHAPLPGSPALDAGNSTIDVLFAPVDQRGAPRFGNDADGDGVAALDIGAVEVQTGALIANQQATLGAILVTSLADTINDDGQVTLREAIQAANTDTSVDGSESGFGEDIIFLAPELGGGTITLSGNDLEITDAVSIVALGDSVTIDANGQSGVLRFTADEGDLTLGGLTITGGITSEDGAGVFFESEGVLTVSQSTITGNIGLGTGAEGGGIAATDGEVRVIDSIVSNNTASNGGGIDVTFIDSLTIVNSEITGNTALSGGGGVASLADIFEIVDSSFNNNTASGFLGGGALDVSGDVTIQNSSFSGNSASASGGAINHILGLLSISGTTFSANQTDGDGGAITTSSGLSITSSTLSGNSASGDGGAIDGSSLGRFTLNDVGVINNLVDGGSFDEGGGISTLGGVIRISNSTIAGNSTTGDGGGIETFAGTIILDNTTVSGNTASGDGGGVISDTDAVFVTNSTIINNAASGEGGGISAGNFASIGGSVVAGNTATGGAPAIDGPAASNGDTLTFIGFSLIDSLVGSSVGLSATVSQGNLIGLSPNLSPLQDNGGSTLTHIPLEGSPLIDAGIPVVFDSLSPSDQRGFLRLFDGDEDGITVADIGAIEVQPEFIPPSDPDADDGPDAGGGGFPFGGGDAPAPLNIAANRILASEDAGLQTIPALVEFVPVGSNQEPLSNGSTTDDPDAESGPVVVAFPVTGLSNPDLFVEPPTVDLDGNLSLLFADDVFGEATFGLAVQTDDNGVLTTSSSELITVTVEPINDAPTIEVDPAQLSPIIASGGFLETVVIVDDIDDLSEDLTLTATSTNPVLLPEANLILSGTGSNRSLFVTPADGQTGTATITVTVADPSGASSNFSFDLAVSPPPIVDEPAIIISPAGFGGEVDPPDLPAGPQPTSFAQQRSQLGQLVFDLAAPIAQVSAADVVLTNLGVSADVDPDSQVPLTDDQLSISPDGLQLIIDFEPGQLADGFYQIELLSGITGGESVTFASDDFFVLSGDFNGDGIVSIEDFATFAYWFGTGAGVAPSYADSNSDGLINIQDFADFAASFGNSVAFPGEPLSAQNSTEGQLVSALNTLVNPADVNGDGSVSPLDALGVINQLSTGETNVVGFSTFDVNRDGQISPLDALTVINDLTSNSVDLSASSQLIALPQAVTSEADAATLIHDFASVSTLGTFSTGGIESDSNFDTGPAVGSADEVFAAVANEDAADPLGEQLETTLELLTL